MRPPENGIDCIVQPVVNLMKRLQQGSCVTLVNELIRNLICRRFCLFIGKLIVTIYVQRMTEKTSSYQITQPEPAKKAGTKVLSPAAQRALAEAEERRAKAAAAEDRPVEHNGPKGQEPTRFGDWERKGIAYDF